MFALIVLLRQDDDQQWRLWLSYAWFIEANVLTIKVSPSGFRGHDFFSYREFSVASRPWHSHSSSGGRCPLL
jgi:hypothetical protein